MAVSVFRGQRVVDVEPAADVASLHHPYRFAGRVETALVAVSVYREQRVVDVEPAADVASLHHPYRLGGRVETALVAVSVFVWDQAHL